MRRWWLGAVVLCLAGATALAQDWNVRAGGPGQTVYWSGAGPYQPSSKDLTIEQQRKLGLSDEQIQKIAAGRRDIEKERVGLEARIKAAQQAAGAANAELARLQGDMTTLLTQRIVKVLDSLMNEDQRKAWHQQEFAEVAKQWLQSYKGWLKLSDAQVDDIAGMLVPVFEKYNKMETDLATARQNLSELRRADKIDVAAIDKTEKDVAELSTPNVFKKRQDELMDKMRAGLMPDQLEKFDKIHHR
jgi:hypothetical protein